MKKSYMSRICFGPDDTSIGGPLGEAPEDVSGDISELFSEITGDVVEPAEPAEPAEPGEGDVKIDGEGEVDPAEVKPEGDDPGEGEVDPDPEVVPVEGEDEPLSEIETLKLQIAELQSQVKNQSVKEPIKKEEDIKIETPPIDLNEMFKDLDFDKVMETKEGFLEFFSKAMVVSQNAAAEKILTSIPNVVGGFVTRQAAMKDIATTFYTNYPELKRVKRYVSQVANDISADDPNLPIMEVLEKAAVAVKETLGIQAKVEATSKTKSSKPTLPGASSTKKKAAPSSKLQNEIDDLLD